MDDEDKEDPAKYLSMKYETYMEMLEKYDHTNSITPWRIPICFFQNGKYLTNSKEIYQQYRQINIEEGKLEKLIKKENHCFYQAAIKKFFNKTN